MLKKYKHIIARHRPRGYKIVMRAMTQHNGLAQFQRHITVDSSLSEREALFTFLHECGHVHHRHLTKHGASFRSERYLDEYEADQYAIKAMRAEGIPIPKESLSDAKEVMREDIKAHHYVNIPEHILRYAYGRNWRKHR